LLKPLVVRRELASPEAQDFIVFDLLQDALAVRAVRTHVASVDQCGAAHIAKRKECVPDEMLAAWAPIVGPDLAHGPEST
jgi:hypothetical protein